MIGTLISPEYCKTIKNVHKKFNWGADGHKHSKKIAKFAKKIGAKTILDYGCGKGTLKTKLSKVCPELKVFEYDPGIIGKDSLPKEADLVVCTDVLEHIEPYMIVNVLKHIRSLSLKGTYFVISCRAANMVLSDGRNAHLIIKNPEWWIKKIERFFDSPKFIIKKKELIAWA